MQRRDKRIYLSPPNIGELEVEQLQDVIRGGWIAPVGPALDQFEAHLEERFVGKRVLGLNAGTAALHLALILSDISDGDEVIVGSFSFAACANVVLYERATPIFIDSEHNTWNLDPDLLAEYLKNNRKPKAVILTHLYGVPARIKEIKSICEEYGVILIEDAAEALGSTYESKPLGSFGDFGILSFNGNKIITTGGGGALITTEPHYQRAKYLATQSNDGVYDYNHDEVGFNYRMSNVLASVGIGQISKLESFIEQKRTLHESYKSILPADFFDFPEEPVGGFCNRWLSTPLLADGLDTLELIRFLDDANIETRRLWKPLHLHPAYANAPFHGPGVCESIYQRGICLPSGTGLLREELDYIGYQIRQFIEMA